MIPSIDRAYQTRSSQSMEIPQLKFRNKFFQNSFFPSTIIEWNKLDISIRDSPSYAVFRKHILAYIRPSSNSLFNVNNPKGVILLTRLCVRLSHLREHKFKHSFLDTLNPICSCGNDIETLSHFFLHCPHFSSEKTNSLV